MSSTSGSVWSSPCIAFAAVLSVLWSTKVSAADPEILVLVPRGDDAIACAFRETAAAVLSATPGVSVVRAPAPTDLGSARRAHAADIAVDGRWTPLAGQVTLADAVRSRSVETGPHEVLELLQKIWPASAPPLADDVWAASSVEALDAACSGEAELAVQRSGAALHRAVRELTASKPAPGRPLLRRWAEAARIAGCDGWRRLEQSLTSGESGPTWRYWQRGESPPNGMQLLGQTVVLTFPHGALAGLSLSTGRRLWRIEGSGEDAELASDGDKRLFMLRRDSVSAIDAQSGRILHEHQMRGVYPELALFGDSYAASSRDVVSLVDMNSGRTLWSHALVHRSVAGPTRLAGHVAVPLSAYVLLLDKENGEILERIPVPDEISSPAMTDGRGHLWTLVGSGSVVRIGGATKAWRVEHFPAPGVGWPPAAANGHLFFATGPSSEWFDPSRGSRGKLAGRPPVRRLADYSGQTYVGRDGRSLETSDRTGSIRWRHSAAEEVVATGLVGEELWYAAGDTLRALDVHDAAPLATIILGDRITDFGMSGHLGAALTDREGVYGFRSARQGPTVRWLQSARLALAQCQLSQGDAGGAAQTAASLLARQPLHVEALAIRARFLEATSGRAASGHWYRLLTAAALGSRWSGQARESLARSVGFVSRFPTKVEAHRLVDGGSDLILASTDESLNVFEVASGRHVRSFSGNRDVWAAGDLLLWGDERVNARTGKRTPVTGRALGLAGGVIVSTGPDSAVRWVGPGGPFSTPMPTGAEALVASEPGLLILKTRDGLRGLDVATGQSRFHLPWAESVSAGAISGEQFVLASGMSVAGFSTLDGGMRFRQRLRARAQRLVPIPGGWLMLVGDRVASLDFRGRVARLQSAEGVQQIVRGADGVTHALLASGRLSRVDVKNRTLLDPLPLGPFVSIARPGAFIAALEVGGRNIVVLRANAVR